MRGRRPPSALRAASSNFGESLPAAALPTAGPCLPFAFGMGSPADGGSWRLHRWRLPSPPPPPSPPPSPVVIRRRPVLGPPIARLPASASQRQPTRLDGQCGTSSYSVPSTSITWQRYGHARLPRRGVLGLLAGAAARFGILDGQSGVAEGVPSPHAALPLLPCRRPCRPRYYE